MSNEDYRGEVAIHPGYIIRERLFAPLAVSEAEFCSRNEISSSQFNKVLNGKSALSATMARDLAAAFSVTPMYLMNLQSKYDLALASGAAQYLPKKMRAKSIAGRSEAG